MNRKNLLGHTALHRACRHGHFAIVNILLKHGADPSATDSVSSEHGKLGDCRSPLHFAAMHASIAVITALLRTNVDINSCDKYGFTPLHLACQSRRPLVVEYLLHAGANPHLASLSRGLTALHQAAMRGCISCVQMLLKSGCDINARTCSETASTALHLAVSVGASVCVRVLLEARADACVRDTEGFTPLHIASAKGNLEIIRILLETETGRLSLIERASSSVSTAPNGSPPIPEEVAACSAVRRQLRHVSQLITPADIYIYI